MGEVPEAERAIFTLSVGFAASSPRGGAKGDEGNELRPEGILGKGHTSVRAGSQ